MDLVSSNNNIRCNQYNNMDWDNKQMNNEEIIKILKLMYEENIIKISQIKEQNNKITQFLNQHEIEDK